MRISEARLNDIVYLSLKHFLFQPVYGENASPRECDIRICMDMAVPERLTLASAILLPNEVAGKSHTKMYDVEEERVFSETIGYIEDHWLKSSLEDAYGDTDVRTKMRVHFQHILDTCLAMPEDSCGA